MVGCCVPGFRVDLNFGFPFQLAGVTYRARLLCSWVARRPELLFPFVNWQESRTVVGCCVGGFCFPFLVGRSHAL